jgi:hypothetical protein
MFAPRCGRSGSILLLSAFLLVVAFAIDVGRVMLVSTELQRTADAAAMAAVVELPDAAAVEAAVAAYVGLNPSGYGGTSHELEYGIWDAQTASFSISAVEEANAVRVRTRKRSADKNAVRLLFAQLLGRGQIDLVKMAIATVENSGLCGGVIGIESLEMNGLTLTDSYNSSAGAYSAGTAGDQGHVCSDGDIRATGNAVINGNAHPGKGRRARFSGNARATGATNSRSDSFDLPSVDTTSAAQSNNNATMPPLGTGKSATSPLDKNRNVSLSGNETYNLPAGTYYWNDLKITGSASLVVNGPTTIYLTGELDLAGNGIANLTRIPGDLKLLVTGQNVDVSGNGNFYGVVYAPDSDVKISGNGDLFGAVTGRSIEINGNAKIHYDQALELEEEFGGTRRVLLVR